ncbi:MAG: hypothetical protein KF768_05075 [Phycisphaeraceae bacterium]|nr:hypothetical protein [Phycisphaeraceae bacterium]
MRGRSVRDSVARNGRAWSWFVSRRGVTSILAMMFMVMFGSLAVAMAIASQGNLRTANTHLHVVRSMGAAETGLRVASQTLAEATRRFYVDKGVVDSDFGARLWRGDFSVGDGRVEVRPARSGRVDAITIAGLADAVLAAHLHDGNLLTVTGFPETASAFDPTGPIDEDLSATGWVRTGLVAIDGDASQSNARPAAYQITYAPLANGTDVRVIVTGYSSIGAAGSEYLYSRAPDGEVVRPIVRQIQQDFRIAKQPSHAILSPARIMIGKNVRVTGNLGALYTDVEREHGHPITMKSDFYGLDSSLDARLDAFYAALAAGDVDGDNRLRVGHAIEGAALASIDPEGDFPAGSFADVNKDGFVDEMDLFIARFDTNGDGRVKLSNALTAGTPAANDAGAPEFTLDDDLALLIDSANPDRNRNSIWGFVDSNNNGRWDPGEEIMDVDSRTGAFRDRVLGWRDGYIDHRDQYAKVRGRLTFKATQQAWSSAHEAYAAQLRGPIRPDRGDGPVRFGADDDDLPAIGRDTFADAQNPLHLAADGASFEQQVAQQLGIAASQLSTYIEAGTDSSVPRYWRGDLDDAYVFSRTGRHLYERMPFGSPAFSDWYYRPRYENMTFRNVQIPRGNNALFINCTFIGVTFVRTYVDNTHPMWSSYGRLVWSESAGRPVPTTDPLDKSDFLRYTTGNVVDGPANYDQFDDPPTIDGSVRTGAARDTKQYSNNIRFHDCLFVGSLTSDTPQAFTHVRNKLQFTGKTRFSQQHPDSPDNPGMNPDESDREVIAKSSLMTPHYSVDLGSFNSPTDTYGDGSQSQNIQLQGTIVAGLLDIRGNTKLDGTMLLTYAPTAGEGPLQLRGEAVGNPANFNSTIGYFGPEDGDGEALDPESLPIVNGQRIVGWDLNGDGLADLGPDQTPTSAQIAAGATAIPFYGYGRIELNWRPDLPMPDGVLLPLSMLTLPETYREGKR